VCLEKVTCVPCIPANANKSNKIKSNHFSTSSIITLTIHAIETLPSVERKIVLGVDQIQIKIHQESLVKKQWNIVSYSYQMLNLFILNILSLVVYNCTTMWINSKLNKLTMYFVVNAILIYIVPSTYLCCTPVKKSKLFITSNCCEIHYESSSAIAIKWEY
jgi:hypothetical protein